jgi:two-component system LytT family response regulator
MLTCIAVEDEPLALKRLMEYIGKIPYLQLIAVFENSLEALTFIHSHKPDVLFLDIQMDELSGIAIMESLNYRPQVIFTTAFDKYAIQGFQLQVTDYLLKPFTLERFLQTAGRLQQSNNQERTVKDVLFIKTESRLEKVNLGDILYIEGMRDYRCLHLEHGRLLTPETFEFLEKQLPQNLFCRVHKSYLVAILKIRLIERDRIVIGKEMIPLSKTYKEKFYKLIKDVG